MSSLRLFTPVLSAVAAFSIGVAGALAPDAGAAAKPPAPTLKISSKLCSIGPLAADRFLRFDVAVGPGDGDVRPAFRVRLQSRPTGKDRWSRVVTTPSDTEVAGWEIASKPNAIVAATKSLGTLEEGRQHRVLVDSRGYNAAGKPSTKMTTRTVACNQPLFTPTLRLLRVTGRLGEQGDFVVTAVVRNAGRLPAGEGTVTVFDADTRETLGESPVQSLKGMARESIAVSIPSCPKRLYVRVHADGADPEELRQDQYATVECPAPEGLSRRRG